MIRASAWAFAIVLLTCALWSAPAWAQNPVDQSAQSVTNGLQSANPAELASALEYARAEAGDRASATLGYVQRYWLPALLRVKRYREAEDLALCAILSNSERTGEVEAVQEVRVRLRLLDGRPKDALIEARSLFNVASIRGTEHALLVVDECLKAAYPGDQAMIARFHREQREGALSPLSPADLQAQLAHADSATVSAPAAAPAPVLAAITVSDQPYRKAIDAAWDDDLGLYSKANLLLLAGRAGAARVIYEKLLAETFSARRLPYHENIARALKAEDAQVGRANAYLRALPQDQRDRP